MKYQKNTQLANILITALKLDCHFACSVFFTKGMTSKSKKKFHHSLLHPIWKVVCGRRICPFGAIGEVEENPFLVCFEKKQTFFFF